MLADVVGTNMVTAAGRLLFPEASNGRLSVLIFHRVIAEPDPLLPDEMTAAHFLKDMQILARQFNVLSLPEALKRLHDGTLPPYALTLTFDDGYRDNFTVALPVLKRLGLPATFFVATGFLDGGRMWNDTLLEILRRWPHDSIDLADWGVPAISVASVEEKRKAYRSLQRWLRRIGLKGRDRFLEMLGARLGESLPTDLMMSSEHVTALSRSGMEIGCHTVSHPILSRVSDEIAHAEIMGAKRRLEALTGKPVRYFAYPNGVPGDDYDIRHVRAVAECGFDAAFSTAWGVATTGCDMYQLPRFTPWDRTSARYVLRFLLSRRQVTCKLVS
tara:strand:- start:7616 stop:8605 length:990 start_codon:yes stop_codon:yes gene_type:complete